MEAPGKLYCEVDQQGDKGVFLFFVSVFGPQVLWSSGRDSLSFCPPLFYKYNILPRTYLTTSQPLTVAVVAACMVRYAQRLVTSGQLIWCCVQVALAETCTRE